MAVGAVVARILTQYSDKGSKAAQKDINKLGKQFDAFAKKTARAFGLAAAAVGAFAIKVGKDAVQAAIADQKSQTLLANSLRNTTGATDAAIASVEAYISKLQLEVGVVDDDLRPALSKLAAVTGDVSAAQNLLGTALDVSAFSGADLSTATKAITKALQGSFRGLQTLVPGIDAATLKSKDFAKILAEVTAITQGSAAARAGTLEYKLQILRIRYGEILETLGYSLLPVIEKFADTIEKKVLPQVEKWIKKNKGDLVKGLASAAKMAVELLMAAVAFSNWIANNMGLIKGLAIAMGTIWAVNKIYAFILGLKAIALSMGLITVAANGATAATLRLKAALGFLLKIGKILGPLLLLLNLSGDSATGAGGYPAGTVGARNAEENAARMRQQKGYMKFLKGRAKEAAAIGGGNLAGLGNLDTILDQMTAAQNKLNNAKKKELSIEDKIINKMLKKYGLTLMTAKIEAKATAAAIAANLTRQGEIASNASTVQLGAQGDGSTGSGISGNGNGNVIVNITTPYGTRDDFFVDVQNNLHTLRRRAGMTPNGRMTGIGLE
jgi:hypothetical protein